MRTQVRGTHLLVDESIRGERELSLFHTRDHSKRLHQSCNTKDNRHILDATQSHLVGIPQFDRVKGWRSNMADNSDHGID